MKKQLLALFVCCSVVVGGYSQKTKTTNYRPFPNQSAKENTVSTKSAQCLLLKKMSSPFDKIEFSYDFDEQRQKYYSIGEIYTDYDYPEYNYKAEYVYDENRNMIKTKIFSWENNEWFYSCYEEFEYDSLGRRTLRINANDLGSGFVIGGKGYYSYNNQGQLVEYLQKLHRGNDVYEDLNKIEYYYEGNKFVRTIDYYYSYGQWTEPFYGDYVYDSVSNLRVGLLNYAFYEDLNATELQTKYEWTRSANGKVAQRDYYRASSSTTWSNFSLDRYEFRYDESTNRYPIYPTITDFKREWEEWFTPQVNGNPNVYTTHKWSTEDQNTGNLAYIFDVTYNYDQVTIGLNDAERNNINMSIYPNPTKDKINIDCSTPLSNSIVKVYNSLGKEVMSQNLSNTEVDLSSLSQGLYLVNVISNGKVVKQEKIVKN